MCQLFYLERDDVCVCVFINICVCTHKNKSCAVPAQGPALVPGILFCSEASGLRCSHFTWILTRKLHQGGTIVQGLPLVQVTRPSEAQWPISLCPAYDCSENLKGHFLIGSVLAYILSLLSINPHPSPFPSHPPTHRHT